MALFPIDAKRDPGVCLLGKLFVTPLHLWVAFPWIGTIVALVAQQGRTGTGLWYLFGGLTAIWSWRFQSKLFTRPTGFLRLTGRCLLSFPLRLMAAYFVAALVTSRSNSFLGLVSWYVAMRIPDWIARVFAKTESLVRGETLSTRREVERKVRKSESKAPRTKERYAWGGLLVSGEVAAPHFALVGTTESGKTVLLRCLMDTVFRSRKGKPAHRALVYDPKADMYPILGGLGIAEEHIVVLNPFDRRSVAWDLAADITSDAEARELAAILIPEDRDSKNPYFVQSTQDVVRALMLGFHETAPGAWTLNDVIEATSSLSNLQAALSVSDEGRALFDIYFKQEGPAAGNIFSTLRTKIGPYATIGRLWARASRKLSLAQWVEDRSLLILGCEDAHASALDPINRAIFRRVSELALSREEGREDLTWFFLDEVRAAKKLDGLLELLVKGRSKGTRVVLGFQDVQGLRDVYGRERADEMIGQCGNVAVLRLTNPETMEWASKLLGKYEYNQQSTSTSHGNHGGSSSVTTSLARRDAVMPAEFRAFPPVGPANGLTGIFTLPGVEAWGGKSDPVPWSFVKRYLRKPARVAGVERRPPEEQSRVPWTAADRVRLKLPSVPTGASATSSQPAPARSPKPVVNPVTTLTPPARRKAP